MRVEVEIALGHIRLGTIPKTKPWKQLFTEFEQPSIDTAAIAASVATGAESQLNNLRGDLRMICVGSHARDPRFQYVERLRGLLITGLRPAFQTVEAKNERHVQDVAEALLKVARETLAREVPMLPFATVATKPDFSDSPSGASAPPLFVEFKYVKERKQLNKVITEVTSRMEIYRKQGAWSLFIVYDPTGVIVDDNKFLAAYADDQTVWIGIAR